MTMPQMGPRCFTAMASLTIHFMTNHNGASMGNSRRWIPRDAVVKKWRHTLLDYLTMALEAGQLSSELSPPELMKLLHDRNRLWIAQVDYHKSKDAFLRYIARYLRRPPLAEYRLLPSEDQEVRFLTKDKKLGRTVTTVYSVREFIARLADQVPDRYRHGVRYFGLLAPQSIGKSYEVFLALLGQKRQPRQDASAGQSRVRRLLGKTRCWIATGTVCIGRG